MEPETFKQLRIKTGSLTRLYKEHSLYILEEQNKRQKQEQLEAENAEEITLKKHKELLDETLSVLPGCVKRLHEAYSDLNLWLQINGEDVIINDTEEKTKALELLGVVSTYLEQYPIQGQQ